MKTARGVSISTCFSETLPLFDQLNMIQAAGFSHVSIGSMHLKYGDSDAARSGLLNDEVRQQFKARLGETGLEVDTLHGASFDEPNALLHLEALIQAAVDLNCDTLFLHHYRGFETFEIKIEEKIQVLLQVCRDIEPLLKEHQIQIAIENLHPQFMERLLESVLSELDPMYFGFCYDASHDQVDGPRSFDLLEKFASRLMSVHLSDRSRAYVDHQLPGEGFIFFADICRILRSYGYNRPVTMEVMMDNSMYQDPEVFLYKAFQSGRTILNQINPVKNIPLSSK